MERDEEGTYARIGSLRRDVIEPCLSEHRGRLVKTTGDGFLAEFASPIEALRCALAIQSSQLVDPNALRLRIGLNLGDVIIEEGGDVYGEGINVAARLEGLANPGGILISGKIYSEVEGKVDADFEDRGEQQVKNISRPVRTYAVSPARKLYRSASIISEQGSFKALPIPNKPSIAVLPFQNMSGDPEQDYFADGIVEDIITGLSQFRSLFVIARNSTFTYKGRSVDVKQVGRDLGVRYVLEGSVRKSGSRVRITGQLIDAETGGHLWADRFDGELENIFDLQDQVTAQVIGLIAPKVEQAEIERARSKSTNNLDAYDYFLRGMANLYASTKEGVDRALQNYSKAIELDPDFAAPLGWATVAYTKRKQALWMFDTNAETSEGIRLARKALEVGKDDALALAAAGFGLAFLGGELDAGLALIDRALDLNPNLAGAWHASGWMRAYVGDPETAIDHLAHAIRLSPRDPEMRQFWIGTSLAMRCAGRYDESMLWAAKVLQESPDFLPALISYAVSSALAGRYVEAQAAMTRALQVEPTLRIASLPILSVLRRPEDRSNYREGARIAGMPE